MNYHNITKDDMLNGDGLRVVLWVSGCTHYCKDCQNPITWGLNSGLEFDDEAKQEIFDELEKDHIHGITFSGGDPLHPSNIECVTELTKEIKRLFPNKTIWLYTGYVFEDIDNLEIIEYLDVLVDGEFVVDQKDIDLHWVGSSNQRVIDIQETLREGEIVLHEKM